MKRISVLLLFVGVSVALPRHSIVPLKNAADTRISDGTPATRGQFPWQVFIRMLYPQGYSACGGSLISANWVLSAGHCTHGASQFIISLGALNPDDTIAEEGKVVITTSIVIVHEAYGPILLFNDIAVVNLGRDVTFSDTIQPIALGKHTVLAGTVLTLSGWGRTSNSTGISPILNYAQLYTISNLRCQLAFLLSGVIVTPQMLCCNTATTQNACQGDSGGPLVQQLIDGTWVHVGTVSFGNTNCGNRDPTGYSRTEKYIEWIKTNTGI